MREHLMPGRFLDSDHPALIQFAETAEASVDTSAGSGLYIDGADKHHRKLPGLFCAGRW